jgi:hypothetical protein
MQLVPLRLAAAVPARRLRPARRGGALQVESSRSIAHNL